MWQDALRVCKEYVPHKLQQLQGKLIDWLVGV